MTGEVVSIKKVDCNDEFVYNLEVESPDEMNKNYFADDVLVSNCHRLSDASSDSLLKLIEEPPSHIRFILCTTDAQKMRPAIQSRCQRHDFHKIYWSEISDKLEQVTKGEKVECEKAALNLCARMADGSMRDGLQHLEKLMSFVDNETITAEHAQKMFGAVSELFYYDLLDEIIGTKNDKKADATEGYRIINKILAEGADFTMVCDDIARHLRNLMIALTSSKAYEFISVSQAGKQRMLQELKLLQEKKKLDAILDCLTLLSKTTEYVQLNLSPDTVLEKWFLQSMFIFRS